MKKIQKVIWLVLILLASIILFLQRDSFSDLAGYGYLGLFLLSVVGNATIILPMPVVVTAFLGGSIYNPFWVAVVIALGATIGELTGYFAGRQSKDLLLDTRIEKIHKWMDRWGMWTLLVLAAIPNPAFDLAGIVSGATGLSVYKYFMIVFLGKFIKFASIAFLGAGTVSLFTGS